ncbi:tRNA 2-selenouridine(34) synthase MnmH [Yoonia vestfoldensis]|uniref:tRNA 2-selenouridine synthase n=1 Tax=Yoonia vestfoldensis TaxID=245188 RepID=A0A1Y0EDE2_9RHOB|nr:tRNA 2-selenouridine(34) synthase MnmH [Yoonia vestfoldensis]ARU01646.1 tRNA 2-selenouridine synthase [Yoonia vestfoldensis]
MPIAFATLDDLLNHGFDTVIDVRSPAEFALDHIPGAINLPALSNAERAQIGTIYKQVSPFEARKLGASLVARNVADHIAQAMADKDGSWRPLVYCWRGGQRSGSFAAILSQIGWRTDTVQGGYQTFRRLVQQAVYDRPLPQRIILLDGNTGTAKTALLARLAAKGVQVIDLEALANHRGSLLGGTAQGQPSQRAFETRIALALHRLDPARPVLIEAESSKIGRLIIPPMLWSAMSAAGRITVHAPLAARARYLAQAYADIAADPQEMARRLTPLRYIRGHDVVDHWLALLHAGDLTGFAHALMDQHYDPAYAKSRKAVAHDILADLQSDTLDDAGQDRLVAAILPLLSAG